MTLPLVTAVAPRWEVDLAGALARSRRTHVARRCADVAELLGVAAAGLARVAVVSCDLRGLDRPALDQLRAHDVDVLGVHPPGDEVGARTLRRWGVRVVLPADSTTPELDEAIGRLVDGETEQDEDPAVDLPTTGATAHGRGGADSAEDGDRERTGRPAGERAEEPIDERAEGQNADRRSRWSMRRMAATTGGEGAEGIDAQGDGRGEGGGPEGGGSRGTDLGGPDPAGSDGATSEGATSWADDLDLGGLLPEQEVEGTGEEYARGRLVVVWGPPGSPGRTTVAVNLAAELADPLHPAVLVDADTYASSVAQVLGVLDEVPGVAAAARVADHGTLDRAALADLAPEVRPGLRVLTGLPRADRWPELRDVALADVLETCRQLAAWTVVDVAACLEEDEELSFDTLAPRRNGATLTALEAADSVVVVGSADPVGLQRLVRGLDELGDRSQAPRTVVVTRARPGPVGRDHGRRIRESLQRFAGLDTVHLVPEDQEALDVALLHGSTLEEVRPRSAARMAMVDLAVRLGGRPRHVRQSGQAPQDRRGPGTRDGARRSLRRRGPQTPD